ncbi:MAG: peptidase S41, partial [bacterium]|nr:peptidase S41 [bacterium]
MISTIRKKIIPVILVVTSVLVLLSAGCGNERNRQSGNIETFARLYGYVKYFHPSDEASRIDWDRFAVYGVKRVSAARNRGELKQILETLFLPIAPSLVIYPVEEKRTILWSSISPGETKGMKIVSWQHLGVQTRERSGTFRSMRLNRGKNDPEGRGRLFRRQLKIGEHINKELGMGLSCIVPLALYGGEESTYPAGDPQAFRELATALEKDIPVELTASDLYVRYAGIMITWNVFRHFYPYFDAVNVDWNRQLPDSLEKAYGAKSELEFLNTLRCMVAQAYDGNGSVYHPVVKELNGFPFKLQLIGGRMVITASEDKRFQRGDIVLSIDGVGVEQLVKRMGEFVSGSPQWKRNRIMRIIGLGMKGSIARLEIGRGSRSLRFEVSRDFDRRVREFVRPGVQGLAGGIYYVDLGKVRVGELRGVLGKLASAKGVIFDVRGRVSSDKQWILAHLVGSNIQSPFWNVPQVVYPDWGDVFYISSQREVYPGEPRITGRVVFLVDANVIGVSEGFMAMVEHYKLGEIVGRPTAGTDGNVNSFAVPGGYRVFFTGMRVLKHDRSLL